MGVFISHATQDSAVADQLAKALMVRGIQAFRDDQGMAAETDWKEAVEAAAARADGFVFVLGSAASDRHQEYSTGTWHCSRAASYAIWYEPDAQFCGAGTERLRITRNSSPILRDLIRFDMNYRSGR